MKSLHWLPACPDFRPSLRALRDAPNWAAAKALAGHALDFIQTNALDKIVQDAGLPEVEAGEKPLRIAILSSCTVTHLHAGIRIGALRRGIAAEVYETDYGQIWQELNDPASGLHAFRPHVCLFALDAHWLTSGFDLAMPAAAADAALGARIGQIEEFWRLARTAFDCTVIQQTALPTLLRLLGNAEGAAPGAPARALERINERIVATAAACGVQVLALHARVAVDGLAAWHDPALWHRSKQEISPVAVPAYGEAVGRILGAIRGKASKCLVLDLDNTLWGGVIGDDGVEGIVLGQGSALGEAFTAFQKYALDLSRRGIILAVCSKNDEANALEPFERHPEMVLKREHIAVFVANWTDKASNLRTIAKTLNIGIDALVFVDDNPFERNLVRQELPMVAVPEVGDDPSTYAQTVAEAGYFEALGITADDLARTAQYRENAERNALMADSTDLEGYLASLDMKLEWRDFDRLGLPRVTQLINKSNQFNLTTKRYTQEEVAAVMAAPDALGLQLRLTDRFGDNGIIAVIIGRMVDGTDLDIDTWLMSCRVLGRGVERATLELIAARAKELGATRLLGEYLPSKKNGMVKAHYDGLGFTPIDSGSVGQRYVLDLDAYESQPISMTIIEGSK